MNNNLNYSQGWRSKLLADKSIFFSKHSSQITHQKEKEKKIDRVDSVPIISS